ncbi:GumC family protein [Microvirga subterranea]|uniref:GumC family protein n=1 Tax=Microvirga subterranea TaxID=186651 RepID=UPI0014731EA0|nr:Wzz/FepE/Etk N-terminal domain-containing protein [Microvirga subterranea]
MNIHPRAGEPLVPEPGNKANELLADSSMRSMGGASREFQSTGIITRVAGAVWRHLWLAAAVAAGITILATGIVLSLGERYTATALLVVDQRDLRLLGLETPTPTAALPSVDSEVEIMKSASIAQEVAARLNLAQDPKFMASGDAGGGSLSHTVSNGISSVGSLLQSIFGTSDKDPLSRGNNQDGRGRSRVDPNAIAAQALQKITAVRRRGLTNVIAIDVTAESATEAARLANAYADTYIDGQINARLESAERAEVALSKRVSELGEALRRSETQIKAFALAQASQPADDSNRREIDRLQGSIASVMREASASTARLKELDELTASRNYASLSQALSIPEMALLDEQRRALEQRLQRPAEGDNRSADLRQRLELLNSQLQTLTNQRVEPIRRQADANNERLASLRRELEQVVQKSDLSTDISVQLFRLQQEAASTRQLYQEYLGRLKALAQQRNIASSDVHVVAPASAPPVKSFPPRTILVLLGGFAGLAIGIGAAYARDTYPRNIKYPAELEDITDVRNVGTVPDIRKSARHGRIVSPEDQILDQPTSEYSEAIRRLRISLDLLEGSGFGSRSIVVTSAHSAEGKSTIALSLGRAAAEAGLKVILLDCNLRDPSLHTRLGLENHDGLVQLLLSPSSIPEHYVIASDPRSTCSVITSGEIGEIVPDRVLESPRFNKLVRELGTKFDLVILDAPAAGAAADPLILAQHTDTVLFVARAGRASPQSVQEAIQQMRGVKGSRIVTALNFGMPSLDISVGMFRRDTH